MPLGRPLAIVRALVLERFGAFAVSLHIARHPDETMFEGVPQHFTFSSAAGSSVIP
jgi:hypothetical protein